MGVSLRMNIPAGGGEEGRVIIHNSVGAGKSLVGPVFAEVFRPSSFLPIITLACHPILSLFIPRSYKHTTPAVYITSSTASELGSTYSANNLQNCQPLIIQRIHHGRAPRRIQQS